MNSQQIIEIRASKGDNLNKIIDRANELDKPVRIIISEGEYEIYDTLILKRDNISIVGENNNVIIRGSKRINIDGLEADNGIITVDLKNNNILNTGNFGEGPFEDFWMVYDIPKPHMTDCGPGAELFYDNKIMPLSRYPKIGFIDIKQSLGKTDTFYMEERNGSEEGIFIPDDDEIRKFENFKDLMLIGYWQYDWATQRHIVENVDSDTGAIELKKPYHCFGYRDGKSYFDDKAGKFYVINVKEKISQPGEWAIDRENMLLYIFPYKYQSYVDISMADDLIYANGCKNISISGIKISECRKSAIVAENCSNVQISDIEVKNVGGWGILGENCECMEISACHVSDTGGGGIALNGGDRQTLKSSENVISNCVVHDIARWHKTYMAAIDIGGVGVRVLKNRIYDVPHFGIVFSGNNHIIEMNDIKNACYESNDAGAIYSGKNYTYRGHIIRCNYIHDLYGCDNAGCMGVYFDDGMSSAEVYDNIFANIPHMALLIGGGRDFYVHDNTFFNCKMAINYDKRVCFLADMQKRLCERLLEVDYKTEIWKKAYPKLYDIAENDIYMPLGNVICNNTVIGGEGFALQKRDMCDITDIHSNKFININKTAKHSTNYEDWYYITDSTDEQN